VPQHVRHFTTEQRLVNILQMRQLFGFEVPRGQAIRAVCLSDLSSAELEAAFHRGLNIRGAVEPWAVVMLRRRAWEIGLRPVVYADWQKIHEHRNALESIYGDGWGALAVPTELRPMLEREDWTSEREWRYCFARDAFGALGIEHGVAAIIVGRSGWVPPYEVQLPPAAVLTPERWLWDAETKQLVHDGRVGVWSPDAAPVRA
jgi:hypothetical protein